MGRSIMENLRIGVEIHRKGNGIDYRRQQLLDMHGIRTVLDVGANIGQYGRRLRASGYAGHIASFEPIPDAVRQLKEHGDANWTVRQVGVGATSDTLSLHVSEASDCSSFLPVADALTSVYALAEAVDEITVAIEPLDDLAASEVGPIALKIDTQGFEHEVLSGAAETLNRTSVLEIEMALVPTYEGGSTIYDLLPRMRELGFVATAIFGGYISADSPQMLDVDVLLVRS